MAVGDSALALCDADGLTDADGLLDADGEADADGDCDADGDFDGELDADGDFEADGDDDAEGDAEADGDTDGVMLALAELEDEGDGEAETEADGDVDADGDELTTMPGVVTIFSSRPSIFSVTSKSGSVPLTASPTHSKTSLLIWPDFRCANVMVPGIDYQASSSAYSRMKSKCVAVSTSDPVLPAVIAVFSSQAANDAPSARTVVPVVPGCRTVLRVRFAWANAASLTPLAPCVPRMSTVVTEPALPPIAIALHPIMRGLKPAYAGTSVTPAFTSAMVFRKRSTKTLPTLVTRRAPVPACVATLLPPLSRAQ